MTHKDMDLQPNSAWECIDPEVGAGMRELEDAETSTERALQLRAHLELCDACRLDQALCRHLETELMAGRLTMPRARIRRQTWWHRPPLLAATGSVLIAACLTLLMFLPPSPAGDPVHLRGEPGEGRFLRPVEGEMVHPEGAVLSWTPVEGATSYRITLTGVDVDFTWEGTTPDTQFTLPALNLDPARQQLRAVLTTVPTDLVAAGHISVSFRTGSQSEVVRDRFGRAPLWMNLLWLSGLVLLILSVWSIDRRTRTINEN